MNRSNEDDAQLREVFRLLKAADERSCPSFHDLAAKPLEWSPRATVGFRLSIACVAAAAIVAACFFLRSSRDDSTCDIVSSGSDKNTTSAPASSDRPAVEIDSDRVRRSLDDYFLAATASHDPDIRLWSSRTDSLLFLPLNQPTVQE